MLNRGAVFNTLGYDSNSEVKISSLPRNATFISSGYLSHKVCNHMLPYDSSVNNPPAMFFIDNPDDDEVEFGMVVWAGDPAWPQNYSLKLYTVHLGDYPAITYDSSTPIEYHNADEIGYFDNILGIKKVMIDTTAWYYMYYAMIQSTTIDYYRVEIEPGVGSTNYLVVSIDADWSEVSDTLRQHIVHDRVCYTNYMIDIAGTLYHKLWSLNLETEDYGEIVSYAIPAKLDHYHDIGIVFDDSISSLHVFGYGEIHSTYHYHGYMYIDGVESSVFEVVGDPAMVYDTHTTPRNINQYNNNMFSLYVVKVIGLGTTDYYHGIYISEDLIITHTSGTVFDGNIYLTPTLLMFNSVAKYPVVVLDTWTLDYVERPVQNYDDVPFTIDGVATIYQIYPTIDLDNSRIYVNAKLDDDSIALLTVDPEDFSIQTVMPIHPGTTYQACFNHGAFFVRWNASGVYVDYLTKSKYYMNDAILLEMN